MPSSTPSPNSRATGSVSSDGKVLDASICGTGVKFHHGREFTSQDVELHDQAACSIPPLRRWAAAYSAWCTTIETPSPYVVKFNLSEPYADLPMMFGAVYARILPFDAAADVAKTPIGTGPFKMKEFVPADHVTHGAPHRLLGKRTPPASSFRTWTSCGR